MKAAQTDHPIQGVLAARWSPYAFADRPVALADLRALFEAARWAASSRNEQPWRYIVGTREAPAQFARVLECLVPANQAWAKAVPVLALGVVSLTFAHNGVPNDTAGHDLGLASGNLCVEATARGLHVHQMAGILPEQARTVFGIPAGFAALTALAIGYAGDPATLAEPYGARDLAPRQRRSQAEFVFGAAWGQAFQG